MPQRTKHIVLICATSAAFLWWGVLHGQVQRSSSSVVGQARRSPLGAVGLVRRSLDVGGQTVPERVAGAGTVFLRMQSDNGNDTRVQYQGLDALELRLLEVEIRKWEAKVQETSLLRRIIPGIHFSASYGIRDLAFIDPTSYTPYVLPRDAYRVTLTLTLNDILFSPAHSQALVELEKLREILAIRRLQQASENRLLHQELTAIQIQIGAYEKELALVQELLRFNQLRFEQNKIEFDVLTRTKIELLNLQRSIDRTRHQQSEIQLRLTGK